MWLYDAKLKKCRIFVYGMCGGNKNRFGTEEACLKTCGEKNELLVFQPDQTPLNSFPQHYSSPFCPSFNSIGIWECTLRNKKVPTSYLTNTVICRLTCDGTNYISVKITCEKGKWKKVNIFHFFSRLGILKGR